jgi:hypothetical protein
MPKLLKVEYLYRWQQRAADIFEGELGNDREACSAEDKKGSQTCLKVDPTVVVGA